MVRECTDLDILVHNWQKKNWCVATASKMDGMFSLVGESSAVDHNLKLSPSPLLNAEIK